MWHYTSNTPSSIAVRTQQTCVTSSNGRVPAVNISSLYELMAASHLNHACLLVHTTLGLPPGIDLSSTGKARREMLAFTENCTVRLVSPVPLFVTVNSRCCTQVTHQTAQRITEVSEVDD
jgi:hypothetical protein